MSENRIFLLPGELAVKKSPVKIVTLLGSCVAICLYNVKKHFGGMNHFMLPFGKGTNEEMYRYGNYSTKRLIELMLRGDSDIRNISAKVYGGGAILGHMVKTSNVGQKNIDMALKILAEHEIKIEEKDIGGTHGRKIFFENWTGKVENNKIEKSDFTKTREKREAQLSERKIRVLVVDDSVTVRNLMKKGINQHPKMEVVGEAQDAFEARSMVLELDPDVITLDIVMPKMDGITFLKKMMVYKPKPIIIVSTIAQANSPMRERARKIGAVGVIDKEELKIYKGFEKIRSVLCSKIESVASLPVGKKTEEEIKSI